MRISDWSSDVCSSDLLLTSAATALALHDVARRQTIIVETSELLQKHATSNEMIDLDTHNLCVTVAELDDPESFLETDSGAAFVKSIVSDLYYERYERHRSDGPMPHTAANERSEEHTYELKSPIRISYA